MASRLGGLDGRWVGGGRWMDGVLGGWIGICSTGVIATGGDGAVGTLQVQRGRMRVAHAREVPQMYSLAGMTECRALMAAWWLDAGCWMYCTESCTVL